MWKLVAVICFSKWFQPLWAPPQHIHDFFATEIYNQWHIQIPTPPTSTASWVRATKGVHILYTPCKGEERTQWRSPKTANNKKLTWHMLTWSPELVTHVQTVALGRVQVVRNLHVLGRELAFRGDFISVLKCISARNLKNTVFPSKDAIWRPKATIFEKNVLQKR